MLSRPLLARKHGPVAAHLVVTGGSAVGAHPDVAIVDRHAQHVVGRQRIGRPEGFPSPGGTVHASQSARCSRPDLPGVRRHHAHPIGRQSVGGAVEGPQITDHVDQGLVGCNPGTLGVPDHPRIAGSRRSRESAESHKHKYKKARPAASHTFSSSMLSCLISISPRPVAWAIFR